MPNVAWERRANTPESLDSPAGTDKETTQQKQISENTSRKPILLSPEIFMQADTLSTAFHLCIAFANVPYGFRTVFFRLVIKLLFYFCNFALQAEGGNVGGTARDGEAAIMTCNRLCGRDRSHPCY